MIKYSKGDILILDELDCNLTEQEVINISSCISDISSFWKDSGEEVSMNMSKRRYSVEQLCQMYPEKYIAVKHICKNENNIIVSAEVLKVYDTLEDCKSRVNELQFYMKLYKDDFDVIYGDFKDYIETRTDCGVIEIPFDKFTTVNEDGTVAIDAFKAFGSIAFEMFNPGYLDEVLHEINETKTKK